MKPLYPYLENNWYRTIWECSEGKGNLTKAFQDSGYDVIGTDILKGQNFLTYELEEDYPESPEEIAEYETLYKREMKREENELTLENWKHIAKELWKLLDAIDFASCVFNSKSDSFYEYITENVAKRNEFMGSDGRNLTPIKHSKVKK